jgi:hypothetical protein
MYKYLLMLFCAALFTSCDKKEPSDCGSMACTLDFRAVGISFTDKDGAPVAVKNYNVINQRTNEPIVIDNPAIPHTIGSYLVATDADRKKLSAEGDDIKVTGTYELTNQTKSAILKVAGGECSCHIEKISGPEKIAFD